MIALIRSAPLPRGPRPETIVGERGQRGFLLHVLLRALFLLPLPYLAFVVAARPQDIERALVQTAFGEAVNLGILLLLRLGRATIAAFVQVVAFWLFFFVTAWTADGTRSPAYPMGFPLVILLAGMLISTRAAIVTTIASILAGLAFLVATTHGVGPKAPLEDQALTWVLSLCMFPMTAIVRHLSSGQIVTSLVKLRAAHEEIRDLNASLEQEVAERTAELAASNRELEAFSSAVSHDLRAPLRTINAFSDALAEQEASTLGPEGADSLARIRAACVRMDRLIGALLELSRITRSELHRTDVDLSELARSIGGELARAEPKRSVELVVEPELHAQGDPTLLGVVLTNLLSNAWKFTSKTASPRVEVGAIPGESGPPVFYVRDNGVGFDMKDAARLFTAFKRLPTSRDFPGIGVGLATVQRVVVRHGGWIRAESSPGKGATFSFTLEPTVSRAAGSAP